MQSVSISSLVQYIFFGAIAYILAGAPLSNFLGGGSSTGASYAGNRNLSSLNIPEKGLVCEEHKYKGVYVLNKDPLVVYIEGFVSDEEADWILGASDPLFTPSTIWTANTEHLNPLIRLSEKAPLPPSHTTSCIEHRARAFQGFPPYVFIEKLWAQRYSSGGHYTYHFDWSTPTPTSGRVSSFMVYLDANCTGGGTHFPRIKKPTGGEWCKWIECEGDGEEVREGVVFKPVRGNAVFWENLRADGTGYGESWHAGLPVREGTKVGMNIWSWLQVGYEAEGRE